MLSDTFFEDLIFFDKDHITDSTYEELKGKYISRPDFSSECVLNVSLASNSILKWIKAVYNYATIYRILKPMIQKIIEHEKGISDAQQTLGEYRREAEKLKKELESLLEKQRQSIQTAKEAEKALTIMKAKLSKLTTLLDASAPHYSEWAKAKSRLEAQSIYLIGVSILGSAVALYCSPLTPETRFAFIEETKRWLTQEELLPASWFELGISSTSSEGDDVCISDSLIY